MTKEQIEDLNQLSRDHYWTDGDRDDLRKALPRLLEERQRLLEALRAARCQPMAAGEEDCPAEAALAMIDNILGRAIAFAEEEAK